MFIMRSLTSLYFFLSGWGMPAKHWVSFTLDRFSSCFSTPRNFHKFGWQALMLAWSPSCHSSTLLFVRGKWFLVLLYIFHRKHGCVTLIISTHSSQESVFKIVHDDIQVVVEICDFSFFYNSNGCKDNFQPFCRPLVFSHNGFTFMFR